MIDLSGYDLEGKTMSELIAISLEIAKKEKEKAAGETAAGCLVVQNPHVRMLQSKIGGNSNV